MFAGSEPQLDGLSKVFRSIGGGYGRMAGTDLWIREAASGTQVLRVFRKGRMIGPTPPFELRDGAGELLARFKRCFSLAGGRWRFTNANGEKLFEMSVKQKTGFAVSVKSITYGIFIDDVLFAVVSPYQEDGIREYEGKRVRVLEFSGQGVGGPSRRLLFLGVAVALDQIVQHRHN